MWKKKIWGQGHTFFSRSMNSKNNHAQVSAAILNFFSQNFKYNILAIWHNFWLFRNFGSLPVPVCILRSNLGNKCIFSQKYRKRGLSDLIILPSSRTGKINWNWPLIWPNRSQNGGVMTILISRSNDRFYENEDSV